jgi:cell division septal protein FtsQ
MGVAMALHEESKFSARKKAIVLLGLSAIGWGIVVWVMTEAVTLMYAIYSVVHGAHQ